MKGHGFVLKIPVQVGEFEKTFPAGNRQHNAAQGETPGPDRAPGGVGQGEADFALVFFRQVHLGLPESGTVAGNHRAKENAFGAVFAPARRDHIGFEDGQRERELFRQPGPCFGGVREQEPGQQPVAQFPGPLQFFRRNCDRIALSGVISGQLPPAFRAGQDMQQERPAFGPFQHSFGKSGQGLPVRAFAPDFVAHDPVSPICFIRFLARRFSTSTWLTVLPRNCAVSRLENCK